MNLFKKSKSTKWILLGIPCLFILGTVFHFIYKLSGNSAIVGCFAPVNESVWEHTKLSILPMLGWWIIWYWVKGKKLSINRNNWIVAAIIATFSVPTLIIMFYFTYAAGLNIHYLAVDISSYFICIALSQLIGLHVYSYGNFSNKALICFILLILLFLLMYILFTFYTPHLPMFLDNSNGIYGIPK